MSPDVGRLGCPRAIHPTLLITTADDFGLTVGVNEAVEQAATKGILTSASLMVSAPNAPDAVRRARDVPHLAVGLHVVVIDGRATLPPRQVPDLVDQDGYFPKDQLSLSVRYFMRPRVRRQLAAEIRAQFEAFRATGLVLDHANAHKHMHLHPTVGRMVIDIGREYGLRALRVPCEPARAADGIGSRALRGWTRVLRGQARRAGLVTNDHVLGLADTGHMTPARTQHLLDTLPPGLSEMYFHPATHRDDTLVRLMPEYKHVAELSALMSARLPAGMTLTTYRAQT